MNLSLVWNNIGKEPDKYDERILVICEVIDYYRNPYADQTYDIELLPCVYDHKTWEHLRDSLRIVMWAYVRDLLPEGIDNLFKKPETLLDHVREVNDYRE